MESLVSELQRRIENDVEALKKVSTQNIDYLRGCIFAYEDILELIKELEKED